MGTHSAKWAYQNEQGHPVCFAARWDTSTGKEFRPITLYEDGWRIKALGEGRVIYNLPEVLAATHIIVTEGEKAADAARSIGFVATTSPGGAQAAKYADWSPLANKNVLILPDNDDAGNKYADDVDRFLTLQGSTTRIFALPGLEVGGDMADWVAARAGTMSIEDMREEFRRIVNPPVVLVEEEEEREILPLAPRDPDALPLSDFMVPGFIAEVMAYNLETARYPQPQLAFAGAISLLATLTGHKIRDEGDCRTNIYVLSLARSGAGKEHARRVNRRILRDTKLDTLLGPETFKSGTSVLTELKESPTTCLLCQLDEFNMLLRSLKSAHVAPHLQDVQTKFLTIYGASNDTYYGDGYADRSQRTILVQPHLVIHGTAPLTDFWTSMSIEGVRDGLLGRMMIFEGMPTEAVRGSLLPPPTSVLDRAAWWGRLEVPKEGNIGAPIPHVMKYTREADARLFGHIQETSKRSIAEDDKTAAIWARTPEKTTKLAMLFAASRAIATSDFEIGIDDVERAIKISNWLTRKMNRKIYDHVSVNDREANSKKIEGLLASQAMTKSEIIRATRGLEVRQRDELLKELEDSGTIEKFPSPSKTKKGSIYSLVSKRIGNLAICEGNYSDSCRNAN
jgi:hypothetical protein